MSNNKNIHDDDFENKDFEFNTEEYSSKSDAAFEAFLKSIDYDENEPEKSSKPEKLQTEDTEYSAGEDLLEADNYDSYDNTQVISDEELAKLLDMSIGKLREVENEGVEELSSYDNEEYNTQIFSEPISADDGTRVFKNSDESDESITEDDVDMTHVFKDHGKQRAETESADEPNEESAEDESYDARDFRPVRRRRNYRTGCMGGILYFVMIVCISVILATLCWFAANDVLSLDKEEVVAEIVIPDNFTIEKVAKDLKDANIIKYPFLFKIFSKFSDADEKIDPGTYSLNSTWDYRALVTNMQKSAPARVTVEVTIPEGRTLKQTFEILEANNVGTVEELMNCAATYEFNYPFLEGLEPGSATRLEGFLFPDTYEFYENSDPEDAIKKFLDNFKRKVTEEMYAEAEALGYSFNDILTVASMVEMEAAYDSERPAIASVIYNRLRSSDFPYLQIDATVQYALGERKEKLSYEDLQVDSPYNTYTNQGLPPGPIANPGLASIQSALTPESTNYYYYALSKDGGHRFFTYYSSFEAFVNSSDFAS